MALPTTLSPKFTSAVDPKLLRAARRRPHGGGGGGTAFDPTAGPVAGGAAILTNSNRTATLSNTAGGNYSIPSVAAISGTVRFEITAGAVPFIEIGIGNAGLFSGLFGSGSGIVLESNGNVYIGFSMQGSTGITWTTGDTIGVEIITSTKKIRFVKNSGTLSADFDYSSIAGTVYGYIGLGTGGGANASGVWNSDASAFVTTTTAGYGGF